MVFIPHGMDQLFGNARATIYPLMNGVVARAVMETHEGRRAYRSRCHLFLTNVFDAAKINQRIDQRLVILKSALNQNDGALLEREAASLKQRVAERIANAAQQLERNPFETLGFENNLASITNWHPVDVPEGGRLVRTTTPEQKSALLIEAGPITSASWRSKVLLAKGRYRFEARAKTSGVEPLPFGKNHGATLRVTGPAATRPGALLRDSAWTALSAAFEIENREQEVELICELRARNGTAWFDESSLRLVRVE
jgi:hypothetical protein